MKKFPLMVAAIYLVLAGWFAHSRWKEDPEAHHLALDSAYYLAMAKSWWTGELFPTKAQAFLLPPGYSLFLFGWVPFVKGKLWVIWLIQIILNAGGIYLLIQLWEESPFWSKALSSLCLLFYGPIFLFPASIIAEGIVVPFTAVFFYLVVKNRLPVLQGIILGYLYLLKPSILFFFLVWILWQFFHKSQKWLTPLIASLFLLPLPIIHLAKGQGFLLASAQGGVAFYMGNHPGCEGLFTNSLGLQGEMGKMAEQVLTLTKKRVGRKVTPAEANRYWFFQGLSWAWKDPLGFLRNLFLKGLRLLDSFPYATDHPWLSFFPSMAFFFFIPWGVILVLGSGGIFIRAKENFLFLIYYLGILASLLLFYPSCRHAFLLLPILALGLPRGWVQLKKRSPYSFLFLFLISLSFIGVRDERRQYDPYLFFNKAKAFAMDNRMDKSLAWIDQAISLKSDEAFFYVFRAKIWVAARKIPEAYRDYRLAFALGERSKELINALGGLALSKRDWNIAQWVYEEAVNRYPLDPVGWMNLAQVLTVKGDYAKGWEAYQHAQALGAPPRKDLESYLIRHLPQGH